MPTESVTTRTIPGGWSEREVALGEHVVRISLPAQPDEFLEQLEWSDATAQEADPYWAELWPASLSMARLILLKSWRPHTSAVELGCGIGVVGLAGLLSGLEVEFTDRVNLAVDTAVENARRNGFPRAVGRVLDWANPPLHQYSVVLASDVLYDQKLHSVLLNAIDALLKPEGACWLGDPGRSAAVEFCELAATRGFQLAMSDESGTPEPSFKTGEFRLICLQRPH
ncbi:MAG: hypothetical protein H6822_31445 [Planctomycetaceae bacterium]|nr:hypothetical protein [Planctomycetales bacterium]MCB9926696.1 hypothetical protein [Planctomycetaceae bacterium]